MLTLRRLTYRGNSMRAYEAMSSFHDSTTPIASAIRVGLDAIHDPHCVEDGDSSPPRYHL